MRLCPVSCFSLGENPGPSSPPSWTIIPDEPHKSLDFWYITPHDRDTFIKRVMPYMAARLPRRYLVQRLLEKHNWACEIFGPASTQPEDVSLASLQRTLDSFWQDPRRTTAKLLILTRMSFFTLLRYMYRMRFLKGSGRDRIDLDVPDAQSCETWQYISELTEADVYRLTCVPNKYGAYFYRNSYKGVKRCPAWKRVCARIKALCDAVGLFASLEDPEHNLKELHGNLNSVMSQRLWLRTTARLDETVVLARRTARYVKEIDRRVTSAGSINLELTGGIEQQLRDLQLQYNKLRSTYTTLSQSPQCTSELSAGLQAQRKLWKKELQSLRSRIEGSEARSQRDIATLAIQIEKSRTTLTPSSNPTSAGPSVEVLVACRWLLEHLPAGNSMQQKFGFRWRLFWQSQWEQCKKGSSRDDHPLQGLVDNERNNKVGRALYGTLSHFLHEYGRLRIEPLDPDVQKIVDAISPLHYNSNGEIDLRLERKRWLS